MIAPSLVNAYRKALYVVFDPAGELVLRIGQPSAELAQLHRRYGVSGSAFITACNPTGVLCTPEENARAMADLQGRLSLLPFVTIPGHGRDPAGNWTPEESRLVVGISREMASGLGREWAQNAIVWCGANAEPELLLLR